MSFLERFRRDKSLGPVSSELKQLRRVLSKHNLRDDYSKNLNLYLEFAVKCGLDDKLTLLSCLDLAETLDTFFYQESTRIKTSYWDKLRNSPLRAKRERRTINMKLDSTYFAAISSGTKIYEGRAFDPASVKDYQSISEGDEIIFSINPKSENFIDSCKDMELSHNDRLACTVGNVYFHPRFMGCMNIPLR